MFPYSWLCFFQCENMYNISVRILLYYIIYSILLNHIIYWSTYFITFYSLNSPLLLYSLPPSPPWSPLPTSPSSLLPSSLLHSPTYPLPTYSPPTLPSPTHVPYVHLKRTIPQPWHSPPGRRGGGRREVGLDTCFDSYWIEEFSLSEKKTSRYPSLRLGIVWW